jgi:hypothetical protein
VSASPTGPTAVPACRVLVAVRVFIAVKFPHGTARKQRPANVGVEWPVAGAGPAGEHGG